MGSSLEGFFHPDHQNHLNNPTMKTSLVLGLGLLLMAMASLTEAGCGRNGCCYVNSATGTIITARSGRYKQTCRGGTVCRAFYDDFGGHFYGECDDGYGSNPNAPAYAP